MTIISNAFQLNFIREPQTVPFFNFTHKGHLTSKLNSKMVSVSPSLDPPFIISFSSFTFPSSLCLIFLLYLLKFPCHFYLIVIEQQRQRDKCLLFRYRNASEKWRIHTNTAQENVGHSDNILLSRMHEEHFYFGVNQFSNIFLERAIINEEVLEEDKYH